MKRQHGDGGAIEQAGIAGARFGGGGGGWAVRRQGRALRCKCAAERGSRRKCAADLPHEPKTLARDGADHSLILAGVADRGARGVDAAGQRRFGDDAAVPDALDQIVLGDDAVAVLDEVDQQIEHLRLDCDILAAAGEFAHAGIEHMV